MLLLHGAWPPEPPGIGDRGDGGPWGWQAVTVHWHALQLFPIRRTCEIGSMCGPGLSFFVFFSVDMTGRPLDG